MKYGKKLVALWLVLLLAILPMTSCKTEPQDPFPVVIVPGITGSELQKDGNTVWPPVLGEGTLGALQAMSSLAAMKLDETVEDGVTPVRVAMSEYTDDTSVGAYGAYTDLAVALADTLGYDQVFFFGYDWRRSNLDTAEELNTYIDGVLEKTGAKKVNLVVHSMGGLVTSAYLSKYKADGKLATAVTCGTPFLGAQDATDTLSGEGGFFASESMAPLATVMAEIAATLPSLYELMPKEGWDDLLTDGKLPGDATSAQTKGYAFYQTVTANLSDLWKDVDHVNLSGRSFGTHDPAGEADGDGTVTVYSSTADGLFKENTVTLEVTHVDLVKNTAALQAIVDAVDGEE